MNNSRGHPTSDTFHLTFRWDSECLSISCIMSTGKMKRINSSIKVCWLPTSVSVLRWRRMNWNQVCLTHYNCRVSSITLERVSPVMPDLVRNKKSFFLYFHFYFILFYLFCFLFCFSVGSSSTNSSSSWFQSIFTSKDGMFSIEFDEKFSIWLGYWILYKRII